MAIRDYKTEVAVVGGGLAGIVAAYELLSFGRRVLLIDKDKRENFGGLAKQSFGGVHMIDTPHQRRLKIKDSPELAWRDWQSVAAYESDDEWPRRWAKLYCENSREYIFEFLDSKQIKFLPLVNWAERGLYGPGNTVPRWHITWGTGYEIIFRLLSALEVHSQRQNLELLFDTEIAAIETSNGRATGLHGRAMNSEDEISISAEYVVIASGGICGGDLSHLRANWRRSLGDPPQKLLNGAHDFADGMLHDRVASLGGDSPRGRLPRPQAGYCAGSRRCTPPGTKHGFARVRPFWQGGADASRARSVPIQH